MAKTDNSAIADLIKQTQVAVALNPVLGPQIEQFWQAQEKMLQEAEAFTKHWFERRHSAAKSPLKAVENVTNGGPDPSDVIKTLSDWQQHSVERVVGDVQEWVDLCTRCVGHVTTAEIDANKEGLEKTAKQAASGSKTKHATRV